MRNKFIKKFTVLFALGTIFLASCSIDQKKALPGYITYEELNDIVDTFKDTKEFGRYSYSGNLNYFAISEDLVPSTVNEENLRFSDSLKKYDALWSSYYLRLPLHITPTNWKTDAVNAQGRSLSTKYQLEDKVYRPAGLDKIYYYRRENGGFILRTFAVNKELSIKYPSDIKCHGKWNIEAEYDADGYLLREYFATINSSETNKSKCCYGEANYTYFNQ